MASELAVGKQPALSFVARLRLQPEVPAKSSTLVRLKRCPPALQRMFATSSRRLLRPGSWAAQYVQDCLGRGVHCAGEYATRAMTQASSQLQGGNSAQNAGKVMMSTFCTPEIAPLFHQDCLSNDVQLNKSDFHRTLESSAFK